MQKPVDPPPRRGGLLLIEGEDEARRALQLLLEGRGFDVLAFATARTALAARPVEARFLVADRAAGEAGVLATLRGRGWAGHAVLMTESSAEGGETSFAAVIGKPVRAGELLAALDG